MDLIVTTDVKLKSLINEAVSEAIRKVQENTRLLSSKEACDLLNISYATLKRRIAAGKIKTVNNGNGHYKFRYSEIIKQ